MGSQNKSVEEQRDKLYSQFLNRLLILLWTGFSAGGCLLAALDYALVAQIPERHPVVLGVFLLSGLICMVYWILTYVKNKGVEGVRGLAIFGLVIAIISSSAGGYGMWYNTANIRTYFQGERMLIKDKKATAEILQGYVETWKTTPNYCLSYIAEDAYYATVYNSKGESMTQLVLLSTDESEQVVPESIEDIAITLSDGTSVVVMSDVIEKRLDWDNLSYVSRALQWVIDGKAEIIRINLAEELVDSSDVQEDGMPGTEYSVVISGMSNLKKFFSEAIGAAETEKMFSSFVGVDVSVMYSISLDVGYIGVASTLTINDDMSLLWYIDNYVEVYDWDLGSEDWYSYDFTDSDKNERMIEEAVYNVSSMLQQFSLDVGVDLQAEFEYSDDEDTEPEPEPEIEDVGIRYSTEDGQSIWLFEDGTFTAHLSGGVQYVGTYEIVDDSVISFYYEEGDGAISVITDEWLDYPVAWDTGDGSKFMKVE